MGVQPAARPLCSGSAQPELQLCPCGLCLAKHAARLRAAIMSDCRNVVRACGCQVSSVRWSWNKDEGHTAADLCQSGDHSCVGSG
eukprot:3938014-Rhodomonas_salina.1